MKRKILAYAVVPAVLGFGLLGAGVASAHGLFGGISSLSSEQIATRQKSIFADEATLLGISVDDVKAGWAQGKTLKEIAADHGITADQLKVKMQAAQAAQMKTHLQTLVTAGVITQTQADSRFAAMQARIVNQKAKGGRGHGFPRAHRGEE